MNSLQSTMWPELLVYINSTLLAYAPNHIPYICLTTLLL